MSAGLNIDRDGAVLTLTINRPERRNALDNATYAALTEQLARASADASVSAVILTGAGEHFTAGNDLRDFQAERGAGDSAAMSFLRALTTTDVRSSRPSRAMPSASASRCCSTAISCTSAKAPRCACPSWRWACARKARPACCCPGWPAPAAPPNGCCRARPSAPARRWKPGWPPRSRPPARRWWRPGPRRPIWRPSRRPRCG